MASKVDDPQWTMYHWSSMEGAGMEKHGPHPSDTEVMEINLSVHDEIDFQHNLSGVLSYSDGTGEPYDATYVTQVRALNDALGDSLTWTEVLEEAVVDALQQTSPRLLRAKLVSLAAVAVQWVLDIDSRKEELTDG